MPDSVAQALNRLKAAADQANSGFPKTNWRKIAGPGPDALELDESGGFRGLSHEPGATLTISCNLELPAESHGVNLVGDSLMGTLFSLYPCWISWNGQPVFEDESVPVASGPALFTLIPALKEGANGVLRLTVKLPENQTTGWFIFKLTTPGLRARFEQLDVAWAQLALADALAAATEEHVAVDRASRSIPELIPTDSDSLDECLRQMSAALLPLAGKINEQRVHLIGHSHIDMNWLWTWPDTVEVIKRDFRSVLQLMRDYPELTFSHSQPATYEVIREQEPSLFEETLDRIREGRWEPISMTWVEGDVNMASGEAMARQLLEGVRYTREVLGANPTIFHAPDTFGHAGNLPQLALSAGAKAYYHHRSNAGQEDQWPAYWWEGQNGSRLLGISTYTYNGEILARDLANAAIRAHRWGLPCSLHFHGIGDHGGGPSRQNLDALRRFRVNPLLPEAFCSRLDSYVKEIVDSGIALPEWRGESSAIFEGCYTTHADTKRHNRHGENLLCTADSLAALAAIDADTTPGWRSVLFSQFHDILDGSAIHESYVKNAEDFEAAVELADSTIERSLAVLESGIEPGSIAVTNPASFDREDWVIARGLRPVGPVGPIRLVGEHGHMTTGQYSAEGLGFVARVPAFGTAAYRLDGPSDEPDLVPEPAFAPTDAREVNFLSNVAEEAPYLRIDTPAYRAYLRRDCGILTSFYDKRVGRELVGYGMRRGSDYIDTARPELALNVFQVTDEAPHGMSSWQLHEVRSETNLISAAETKVIETGPARCVVEVVHKVRASVITQRISFYRGIPRVDFDTHLDWQEIGTPETGVPGLKVAFNAHLPECEAWFETPFAAVRRPADGMEVPALRWADVGGPTYGIALLNDCKYGHDALGNRLRITLVRSAYDPDAISDKGPHDIRFSFVPHPGGWREAGIAKQAMGFNQPLIARTVASSDSSGRRPELINPVLNGSESVLISCLKRSHSGDGIVVRLYETAGGISQVTLSGIPSGSRVVETNVVEDSIRELEVRGGAIDLTFRPWQVRTVQIGSRF